jgi:hypothetical protein
MPDLGADLTEHRISDMQIALRKCYFDACFAETGVERLDTFPCEDLSDK